MQPKLINPGLGVIFGRPAAVRPMTNEARLYRSDEERQQEAEHLKATHEATQASRAVWQQAMTNEAREQRDAALPYVLANPPSLQSIWTHGVTRNPGNATGGDAA